MTGWRRHSFYRWHRGLNDAFGGFRADFNTRARYAAARNCDAKCDAKQGFDHL
jgi:hypothetical protein